MFVFLSFFFFPLKTDLFACYICDFVHGLDKILGFEQMS